MLTASDPVALPVAVTVIVGTIAPFAGMQLLMHAVSVAAIPRLALMVIPKSITIVPSGSKRV